MVKPLEEKFITKEFYLICLLHASGIKILEVQKQGRVFSFGFDEPERCNEIRQKLLSGDIQVNAADYINSIRVIKDLIFSS